MCGKSSRHSSARFCGQTSTLSDSIELIPSQDVGDWNRRWLRWGYGTIISGLAAEVLWQAEQAST